MENHIWLFWFCQKMVPYPRFNTGTPCEIYFVHGEQNSPSNGYFIIFVDAGKGRGMFLLLRVIKLTIWDYITFITKLICKEVGNGSVQNFPVRNCFPSDESIQYSLTAEYFPCRENLSDGTLYLMYRFLIYNYSSLQNKIRAVFVVAIFLFTFLPDSLPHTALWYVCEWHILECLPEMWTVSRLKISSKEARS